jgi:putative ABC transport system permease protein
MNGTNLFKIALRALANNKLRAFLTMLGIIIGVASVITMLAIGQGSKRSIQSQIAEMGSNMIMINPGADMRGGVRQDPSAMQTLKLADFHALQDKTKYLSAVSPTVNSSGQFIYGANNYPGSVSGVNTDYLSIRQLSVENGEMFTDADIQSSSKVCVIGKTIADNLFPDGGDPVGRVIRFNKIPFRIVGVLKAKGYNSMGQDQDAVVLAPYTTVMKRLLAVTYLQGIFASALSEDITDQATEEITALLRSNHKLKDGDDDDFNIRSQQELSTMLNSTTDLMTTLLACIAGISLIVGGIGIMNIMYVSVTERTREIGLRMSVGARGIDILSQFLIEAILISITGGIIGVIIGIGASVGVKVLAHWPIYIQPWSVMLSFAVCTVTGVFFGWYPAKKQPIWIQLRLSDTNNKNNCIFVNMKQPVNTKPFGVIIHIISWGIVFGSPFFFLERGTNVFNWSIYLRHMTVPLAFFIVFYINYLVLIPRYLFTNQNRKYIIYNVFLVIIMGIALQVWQELSFALMEPNIPKRKPNAPPRWIFTLRDTVSLIFTIGLSAAIRMSGRWRESELALREAEKSRTEAELRNLRNQLNPHFLLNTLNNICIDRIQQ